jgi:glycosyltransferase involved in cell wall biosynthesis
MFPQACITAISEFQKRLFSGSASSVVPHGIDQSQFSLCETPDDYVCYFGRFMAAKGPLEAIATARSLGLKIVLAGPKNSYFTEHLAPHVDGDRVVYLGQVEGEQRSRLLGRARALLYPIRCAEPFGLVMPEAMMCGTPVVGIRIGAVPEIVDEGITGYTAEGVEGLAGCVTKSFQLDRRRIREMAERRFSARRMAQSYEAVYRSLIDARRSKPAHTYKERHP